MTTFGNHPSLAQSKYAGYTELKFGGDDFKKVEYKLQINLGNTDVDVKKIWNIASPKLLKNYQEFKDQNDQTLEVTPIASPPKKPLANLNGANGRP
jgi:hypothetical protein